MRSLIPLESIERRIYFLRGHKVMLDRDLAELYGVKAIRLREQVGRNRDRFPEDFMFHLTKEEVDVMVSQNAIPSWKRLGGHLPFVFTQEGVAMLSSVLRGQRAVQVNITVMRAFVRLREMVSAHKELAAKLAELERKVASHDGHIRSLFEAIRELMEPPDKSMPQIGFKPCGEE